MLIKIEMTMVVLFHLMDACVLFGYMGMHVVTVYLNPHFHIPLTGYLVIM